MDQMKKKEQLKELLSFLMTVPGSEEFVDFTIKLAEESVTIEMLQEMLKKNVSLEGALKAGIIDDKPLYFSHKSHGKEFGCHL